MHIVKFQGGLGNQMFQYAFGHALSPQVSFDFSWFAEVKKGSGSTVREYGLDVWRCTVCRASEEDVSACQRTVQSHVPKLIRKWLHLPKYRSPQKIVERGSFYRPEFMTQSGLFEGYFQCENYFSSIRQQLLADFTSTADIGKKNNALLAKILSCNAVSLHIRRGDYLKLKNFYALCSPDYYFAAMTRIMKSLGDCQFFVFSDDPAWARQNIRAVSPMIFVDWNTGKSAYCDIWLMKHCKHNITANSSFSWWGAWLNENPNKLVISPRNWFAEKAANRNDIVPQSWVRL